MSPMQRSTLEAIDEAYLEQQMLGTAHERGWLAHHIRDSRRILMGDPGFPDWVLARDGRIVIVELKRETEKPSVKQQLWLQALGIDHQDAPHRVQVYVWRPSDWADGTIRRVLR